MKSIVKVSNKQISVLIDPDNAGTIFHIGKTQSQESNVLAWYQWDDVEPLPYEYTEGQSQENWMSRYRGGWQFLTPNAGIECVHETRRHPFHGDSSNGPWTVTEQSSDAMTMQITCPSFLRVKRRLSLGATKPILKVETSIENLTDKKQEMVLVEHVAFQGTSTVQVSAPPSSQWAMPPGYEEEGVNSLLWSQAGKGKPDLPNPLSSLEGKTVRLAYLTQGSQGWAQFADPGRGVGAKLRWDKEVFPYLWYWQERNSPEAPFFGRAQMTALEPASCLPNDTIVGASQAGRATSIAPHQIYSFSVEVELD